MLQYVMHCTIPKNYHPPEDASWLQQWCYNFSSPITNWKFDAAIMVIIGLNLGVLMMSHDGMSDGWYAVFLPHGPPFEPPMAHRLNHL